MARGAKIASNAADQSSEASSAIARRERITRPTPGDEGGEPGLTYQGEGS